MPSFGIGWATSDEVVNKKFDPYVSAHAKDVVLVQAGVNPRAPDGSCGADSSLLTDSPFRL